MRTDIHTDIHTHETTTVTLTAHAHRGLIIIVKLKAAILLGVMLTFSEEYGAGMVVECEIKKNAYLYSEAKGIIESVDSISRDELDSP